MRLWLILPLTALTLATAACGSSASSSTPSSASTATAGASGTIAPAQSGTGSTRSSTSTGSSTQASAGSTTTTQASPTEQLNAYFATLQPVREQAHAVAGLANAAMQRLSTHPTKAAKTAAQAQLLSAAASFDALTPQLAAIAPPSGLEKAHASYVDSYRTAGIAFRALAGDIRAGDQGRYNSDLNGLQAVSDEITYWRTHLIAYAKALAVTPPAWVTNPAA